MRALLFLFLLCSSFILLAQKKSEQAAAINDQALVAYRNRNLEEALMLSEEALSLDATPETYYLNGLIYEALGKDLRAVSSYEAVLKLDPDHRESLFQKAILYLQYGDPGQAIKDFTSLLAKGGVTETRGIYFETDISGSEATSVVSLVNLESKVFYYRGQAYDKMDKYEKAISDYDEAIKIDSASDYFVARGLTLLKLQNQKRAIYDFKSAINIDEENQLAWYNLALVDPSIKLPTALLEDNSFAPTLGLLASRAMEDENYTDAVKYLTQAITNEKEPLHLINRGRAYIKLQKYDKARADLVAARKLEPTRFECLHLIGNTYFFQKNYRMAVSFYDQYLTVDPQSAMVWYNAAVSHLQLKDNMNA